MGFNSQPPEGGCDLTETERRMIYRFNSQPPEGGCPPRGSRSPSPNWFQLTAARRRLPRVDEVHPLRNQVSTHSRPKAAAASRPLWHDVTLCFNSQPPEGGCAKKRPQIGRKNRVSTHSRPKAAAKLAGIQPLDDVVSTHSRPKAAARTGRVSALSFKVSTHSRPKAAASSTRA